MFWILVIAVVVLAFVALAALKSKQGGSAGTLGFPYQPAKTLFSAAERSFLGILDQATGPDHRVFGKVRVADVAALKTGLTNSARQGALNKIASKHFDFVICRTSDLAVICAVELNDKSHSSQRAQVRDDFIVGLCQSINLPLLQVPAKQAYSAQDLRAQFLAAVGSAQLGTTVGA